MGIGIWGLGLRYGDWDGDMGIRTGIWAENYDRLKKLLEIHWTKMSLLLYQLLSPLRK